jgi:hypothetical protein
MSATRAKLDLSRIFQELIVPAHRPLNPRIISAQKAAVARTVTYARRSTEIQRSQPEQIKASGDRCLGGGCGSVTAKPHSRHSRRLRERERERERKRAVGNRGLPSPYLPAHCVRVHVCMRMCPRRRRPIALSGRMRQPRDISEASSFS